ASSVLPTASYESLFATGAWLAWATLMLNICEADVSTPPLAVPPLSFAVTVTWTVVVGAAKLVLKVNVPVELTAGWAVKMALLLFETRNETVCVPSFGPALMAVAQFAK